MDETPRSNWFQRTPSGLVMQADLGVKPEEVKLYERVNALRKVGAGLALTDTDKAALEATKGEPLHGLPAGIYRPDVTMGFVFYEAGDLVRQLDGIALELAGRLGPAPSWANELLAWATLRAYAQRAEENAKDEAEYFEINTGVAGPVTLPDGTVITVEPAPPVEVAPGVVRLQDGTLQAVETDDPELGERRRAHAEQLRAFEAQAAELRQAAEAAEREAYAQSPAGQAESAPDGGPVGWSTVPPANPAHPLHPDNLPPHVEEA